MVLLLTQKDIKSLLSMQDAILCVEKAYKSLSIGEGYNPQRISIEKDATGQTLIMPGIIEGSVQSIATKIVSIYRKNPHKFNIPAVLAKIILQDIETGEVISIMDGTYLTTLRTGAATGVSVKYLARKDSEFLSIFGAGAQSQAQIEAVYWALNQNLKHCMVYDLNQTSMQNLKTSIEQKLGIDVKISKNPQKLIDNADIIVCATSSKDPLFPGESVKPGTHISSIGSHLPTHRELDENILNTANVIAAGSKHACLNEAGDFIIPLNQGKLDTDKIINIGDIIVGKFQGRDSEEDITVFKSVGIALQDVVIANLTYKRATQNQTGFEFKF
ncbi:MAG: ornithine cyclodeaminase family protein [Promethearchaeota archaeon]|jgi:ornithine cyclodeaminase/alanine dehydrogenase-like protein (mu-crystallin family)